MNIHPEKPKSSYILCSLHYLFGKKTLFNSVVTNV